jgi:hypothetical protein
VNYQEADTKLQGRCRERRKLQNNTYLERRDNGAIAVRLHATDVLSFFKDGSIQICTGGWHTITTVDRINSYIPRPWRVGRHRGLTLLYRMNPTAWTPVCTVDDSAEISRRGRAAGGNVQEYLDGLRTEDNETNRLRSRLRYWVRKAREHKPGRLTAAEILREENSQIRAAKIHAYGFDRLLESNAAVVDTHGEYALLNLPLTQWENMRALKMVCPSTKTMFVQAVPPNVGTICEALDWMFDTKDYLGQVTQQT